MNSEFRKDCIEICKLALDLEVAIVDFGDSFPFVLSSVDYKMLDRFQTQLKDIQYCMFGLSSKYDNISKKDYNHD